MILFLALCLFLHGFLEDVESVIELTWNSFAEVNWKFTSPKDFSITR